MKLSGRAPACRPEERAIRLLMVVLPVAEERELPALQK